MISRICLTLMLLLVAIPTQGWGQNKADKKAIYCFLLLRNRDGENLCNPSRGMTRRIKKWPRRSPRYYAYTGRNPGKMYILYEDSMKEISEEEALSYGSLPIWVLPKEYIAGTEVNGRSERGVARRKLFFVLCVWDTYKNTKHYYLVEAKKVFYDESELEHATSGWYYEEIEKMSALTAGTKS